MKSSLTSLMLLSAAFGVIALAAATDPVLPTGFHVNKVVSATSFIKLGATERMVQEALGAPSLRLTPDIAVFYGYRSEFAEANEQGCDTLVITYAKNVVIDLKLVNRRAVAVIAATLKSEPETRYIAKNP